jgi:hypothetical protein
MENQIKSRKADTLCLLARLQLGLYSSKDFATEVFFSLLNL